MTTPQEDYQAKLTETATITRNQYQKQVATVDEYYGDAMILHRTANQYRSQLGDEGLDLSLIDDLPARSNAFAVAASNIDMAVEEKESDSLQWIGMKKKAYKFRRKLFRYGKFAFDGHEELLSPLSNIINGSGDLDLAHDFIDIHKLYSSNLEKFAQMKKFTPDFLEQGLNYHSILLDLYGKVNRPADEMRGLTTIKKQNFAHLKEATDEIRRWARLAFADEPEILKKFNVNFYRQ